MDIKMMMVGLIIGTLVITSGLIVIGSLATTYPPTSTENFSRIQNNFAGINNEMQGVSSNLTTVFNGPQNGTMLSQSITELDAAYQSAVGVARVTTKSVGMMGLIFGTVGEEIPELSLYMAYAMTAFVIVLIISIAYLIFFRIPR